ncbi:MAG: hypothetical protein QM487_11360 [Candidatus Marithrix sp.]
MKIYLTNILTIFLLLTFPMQSMGWWWDNDTKAETPVSTNSESLWDSMLEHAKELTNKTIEETDRLSSKIIERTKELTNDTKDLVSEKFGNSAEQLKYYQGVMKEAGFKYSGLTVNIGLLPGPDFYFVREAQLTKEQQDALLEKYKDETISSFLLKTIFNTPDTLFLPEHIVEEVTVTFIAIPPKMSITLIPIEDSGIERTKDHLLYFRNK